MDTMVELRLREELLESTIALLTLPNRPLLTGIPELKIFDEAREKARAQLAELRKQMTSEYEIAQNAIAEAAAELEAKRVQEELRLSLENVGG